MLWALALLQASTYCQSYLNGVQCQQQGAGAADALTRQMLSSDAINGFQKGAQQADERRQQQAQAKQLSPEAQQRRAAAYDKVGDLIAQGKCAEAKQLARFYNHTDIIADTDRACP